VRRAAFLFIAENVHGDFTELHGVASCGTAPDNDGDNDGDGD